MSLFEHIAELRYRLIVIALTVIVGTTVCWFFRHQLTDVLFYPYEQARSALLAKNLNADITLFNNGVGSAIHPGAQGVGPRRAVADRSHLALPGLGVHRPGPAGHGEKWTPIFLGSATPLFLAGVAVGYYVMPKGLVVLLGFTENGITNLQDVNQFLSFLMRFMLVFGVAFLIPEIVLILNIVGVLKARYLSKYRSIIIFCTFVFGAVATPSTDPFSMLALALPMSVLFIVAEVIAHILDRRKERRGTLDPVGRDKALRELSDGESA